MQNAITLLTDADVRSDEYSKAARVHTLPILNLNYQFRSLRKSAFTGVERYVHDDYRELVARHGLLDDGENTCSQNYRAEASKAGALSVHYHGVQILYAPPSAAQRVKGKTNGCGDDASRASTHRAEVGVLLMEDGEITPRTFAFDNLWATRRFAAGTRFQVRYWAVTAQENRSFAERARYLQLRAEGRQMWNATPRVVEERGYLGGYVYELQFQWRGAEYTYVGSGRDVRARWEGRMGVVQLVAYLESELLRDGYEVSYQTVAVLSRSSSKKLETLLIQRDGPGLVNVQENEQRPDDEVGEHMRRARAARRAHLETRYDLEFVEVARPLP